MLNKKSETIIKLKENEINIHDSSFKKKAWNALSLLIAAILAMTVFASSVFAQESSDSNAADQTEADFDLSNIKDLFSGLLSGDGENIEINADNVQDLFSSLLGSLGDGAALNEWIPSFEWTVSTQNEGYSLPAEVQASFESATKDITDKSYAPMAFLQEQVVSGMNYRIICAGTEDEEDAVPELDVVTFYVDLAGNASVTDTAVLDLNVVYGERGNESELDTDATIGGWSVPDEEININLPEKFLNSIREFNEDDYFENNYLPIAVLGTTINDDNMLTTALLCRVTPKKADKPSGYEILFLSEDDEGWVGNTFRAPLNIDKLFEQADEAQEASEDEPEDATQ